MVLARSNVNAFEVTKKGKAARGQHLAVELLEKEGLSKRKA